MEIYQAMWLETRKRKADTRPIEMPMALASTFHTAIIDHRHRPICFAAAPPEALFFPVTVATSGNSDGEGLDEVMMAEAISEVRQAFRPNVSSYSELLNEGSSTESQRTTALDLSSLSIFFR